ncbi:MAG: hypothetical protein ACTHXO_05915 [Actinomycetaceae bacterium]
MSSEHQPANPGTSSPQPDALVTRATYRYLRLILITLPALLLLGSVLAFFWWGTIETSISAYYLGPIRDMFVGVLVAIAACLVAYRGSSALEDFSLDVAGFFAIFVALVPTGVGENLSALDPTGRDEMVAALRASCVTVLVVAALFIVVEIRLAPWRPAPLERHRPTRTISNAMNAVLVAFVVLVVWRVIEGGDFAWVHGTAAVLFVVNLAIAVGSHAWPEACGAEEASLDGERRDHRRKYRAIFLLMVVGTPVFGVLHLAGWDYALLAVEWYEIALFITFWVLETRRTWTPPREPAGAATPL